MGVPTQAPRDRGTLPPRKHFLDDSSVAYFEKLHGFHFFQIGWHGQCGWLARGSF